MSAIGQNHSVPHAGRSTWQMKLFTHARPLAHLFWWLTRGLTVGVRAVVLDDAGRVCLVRHTYVAGWHLPGGGLEAGEDPVVALGRELREEAALILAPTSPPQLHGIFHNPRGSRRDYVLVYVVRAFTTVGPRVADGEIAEVAFFTLSDLPAGITAATRARLAEITGSLPPAPLWD